MSTTIETLSNGNVRITRTWTLAPIHFYDPPEQETQVDEYCAIGRYVYRVTTSGQAHQVCERLAPTGPTLMIGDESLEECLRNMLAGTGWM